MHKLKGDPEMNLNSFVYVAEIERCGSINRAAQNLYTSQSNLSTALKALEEELGYPIFRRTSNGSVPTPEGYLFIQSAKAILEEIDKIEDNPQRTGIGDTISLTCNWSAQVLQCLVDFKEHNHPEAHDTYRETSIVQTFDCIYENRYRLAMVDCFHSNLEKYCEMARKTNIEPIVMQQDIPAVALMSDSHPLAHRKSVSLKEVYSYPLVLFEDYSNAESMELMRLKPSQQILYLYDRGGLLDVMQTSESISILKKNTFVDLEKYGLVELPIYDFPDTYDIVLLKRSYYQLNSREEAFIKHLQEQMQAGS